jgi:UDP-glucose 4-epimerase
MNVLITGGAGFIGSHLCDYLIRGGDNRLTIVDNLSLGRIENISHLLHAGNLRFFEQDILDERKMSQLFAKEQFDIIFHMAANSDIAKSHAEPGIDLNNTFMTTYTILNLMRQYNVKKIVFASSSAIYGETAETLTEAYGPLLPLSHYGAAKLASEAFISSFAENYGMQAWIVRFPNVVGERSTHGVIFDFIAKLRKNPRILEVLGNGEQYKPYLYVKDIVEAILFICENSNEKVNCFNVGVESRTKVKDIARMVIEGMELHAEIKYTGGDRGWIGDVPEFSYDLSKIHALGWKAKISSDEAVRKSIRYILEES